MSFRAYSLFITLWIVATSVAQTTPHLQEVFLGKCYDHNPTGTDCAQLWNSFSSAAAMDNRFEADADWAPFFQIANFSTSPSSILFWSGSMDFALAISTNDIRYVTVEETSTGYVTNGLTWCGVPGAGPPAFDYVNPCPYPTNSSYYGLQSFWTQASTLFAQGASGNISVLLQPRPEGSVYRAYRLSSIFGQTELPSMIPGQIQAFTVLLLKNQTAAPTEVCGSGSLLDLQNTVYEKLRINMTCVDDPALVYGTFCPKGTASRQCLAATLVYNQQLQQQLQDNEDYRAWAIAITVISGVLVVICLILGYLVVRKPR